MKNTTSFAWLTVPSALCILSATAEPAVEPQEVQIPDEPPPPLTNLVWRLPPNYATLEGDRLVVDIPTNAYPSEAVATATLPAELFAGAEGFSMTVEAEGTNLARPTREWLGLKFQVHWKESATGREGWPNVRNAIGDLPPTVLRNDATFKGAHPDAVTLELGLQGSSGRVVFDLSTLRGGPSPGLFRRINQDWIVRYPEAPRSGAMTGAASQQMTGAPAAQMNADPSFAGSAGTLHLPAEPAPFIAPKAPVNAAEGGPVIAAEAAQRRPPLRGAMLPTRDTTEEDIEALHRWGATLARFQICRGWTRRDANQDLEDFAAWVDSRLDNLADVLRWAEARGMKIVLDLHVVPGGRNAKDLEDNMLHDDRFAEAWLDTWRRIATRFKGDPALYGYDLWNEPNQKNRARNDYWTLQRRAAEIVRAIDPDTPIIVESNNSAAPSTFSYLSPLRMDNVIYQVHVYVPSTFTHQGINNYETGAKWPDPEKGWDKDFLRKELEPVRAFEARHHARIYVGEFSAIAWAEGAENYLRDCIGLFEEYGWDWTYHAFREWAGWSVEHEGPDPKHLVPAEDTPRKRVLLDGLAGRMRPAGPAE